MPNLVKVGVWKLMGGMPPLDARRVDQDAHLVAIGQDAAREPGHLLLHGEVGRVNRRPAAQLLYGGLCLQAGLVALAERPKMLAGGLVPLEESRGLEGGIAWTNLDENDVGAGFGEPDGDGLSDAARAARHSGGVAREREQLSGHGVCVASKHSV